MRERLREMPHLSNIRRADFQFTRAQVLVGLAAIILSTIISGPLTQIIVNVLILDAQLRPDQLLDMIQFWALRGVVYAVAFILPLALAAAIRLYLTDLAVVRHADAEWLELLTTLILSFIGCFVFSALPVVADEAYRAGKEFSMLTLARGLLWAVPPAIISAGFVVLSGIRRASSLAGNAVFDFITFTALGGFAAVFSGVLLTLMSLRGHEDFSGFRTYFLVQTPLMLMFAIVSGVTGTIQCAASRVFKTEEQA